MFSELVYILCVAYCALAMYSACAFNIKTLGQGAEGLGNWLKWLNFRPLINGLLSMIRRILVPTDFSAVSGDALIYAGELAEALGTKRIDVAHIYTPQTAPDVLVIPPTEEILRDREKALDAFLKQYGTNSDIPIDTELYLGFAADELVRLSLEYDLIVMGTLGETDVLDKVFGSISSTVAQRAHCPVLLVPAGARFREYHNILYASDDLSLSRSLVLDLMDFNELFNARIHFVHVNTRAKDTFKGEREKLFSSLFSGPEPDFAFEISEVNADSLEDGLREYVHSHPIDLSIMATRHRGFWESFFHRSQTKKMALHPELPLLVFHWGDGR